MLQDRQNSTENRTMLNRLDQMFMKMSSFHITAIALLLVSVIAAIDLVTGYELSISIFYLIAVALATWYAGFRQGMLLSIVSAITWLVADITAGHPYTQAFIPLWNAGVRFLFFIVIARLLAIVNSQLKKEQQMARLDGLTGVMNGVAFRESAEATFRIAARYQRSTVIGYIDVDNFKHVNDTLGHNEGDYVLKTIASVLQTSIRETDTVGRLGGDEFAILLPETGSAGAKTVFETLREKLLEKSSEHGWPIGFSIGVAVFPTAPSSLSEAIQYADTLMYRVKNGGKNSMLVETCEKVEKSGHQANAKQLRTS